MPSTNKTPGLGLSQWAITDKPTMEDFNADNEKVDQLLQPLAKGGFLSGTANLYVTKQGNDATGNGTQAAPFQTINRALQYFRTNMLGDYWCIVNIGPGIYNENIHYDGSRGIVLQSTTRNREDTTIQGIGNSRVITIVGASRCYIGDLTICGDASANNMWLVGITAGTTEIGNCNIRGTGAERAAHGILATSGFCNVSQSEISGCRHAVSATNSGAISAYNLTGSNNAIVLNAYAGTIFTNGTVPSGEKPRQHSGGGQIHP